jgi:hypothetical protein
MLIYHRQSTHDKKLHASSTLSEVTKVRRDEKRLEPDDQVGTRKREVNCKVLIGTWRSVLQSFCALRPFAAKTEDRDLILILKDSPRRRQSRRNHGPHKNF